MVIWTLECDNRKGAEVKAGDQTGSGRRKTDNRPASDETADRLDDASSGQTALQ